MQLCFHLISYVKYVILGNKGPTKKKKKKNCSDAKVRTLEWGISQKF